jgi:hypothetical protein
MTKRTMGLLVVVGLWVVLINSRPVYAQQPRVGDRQCGREFLVAERQTWNDLMAHARDAANYGFFVRLGDQVLTSIEYGLNIAGNVGQTAVCIALR